MSVLLLKLSTDAFEIPTYLRPVIRSRAFPSFPSIASHSKTMIPPPPNQVYSGFSFIGFVLSVIPFYWHVAGTCSVFAYWSALIYQRAAQLGIQGLAFLCSGRVLDVCCSSLIRLYGTRTWSTGFRPTVKPLSILQSRLVHFASTAASTRSQQ